LLKKFSDRQHFAFHATVHLLFPGFQFGGGNMFDERGLIIAVFKEPRGPDQVDDQIRLHGLLQHPHDVIVFGVDRRVLLVDNRNR
jgi:hypothetical protein